MNIKSITVLMGIVILFLAYFLWRVDHDYKGAVNLSKKKDDTAHYWKDRFGHEHATLEQTTMSKAAAELLHGKELDSLAKLYKTSSGRIKEHTVWKDLTTIDITPAKVDTVYYPRDTTGNQPTGQKIRRLTGTFTDPWLDAMAMLGDTNRIKVMVSDTTSVNRHTKGFFRPKTYLDISHVAPYVRSSDIKSYVVEDAGSRIEVVVFAGAGTSLSDFNLVRPVPFIGLGVAYRLFSLGKR
jgi:hypothetical protein